MVDEAVVVHVCRDLFGDVQFSRRLVEPDDVFRPFYIHRPAVGAGHICSPQGVVIKNRPAVGQDSGEIGFPVDLYLEGILL